ncbi:MAG: hypothetical protein AAGD25_38905 [Cyanobacteria bacterium P01_F01_bin.150]
MERSPFQSPNVAIFTSQYQCLLETSCFDSVVRSPTIRIQLPFPTATTSRLSYGSSPDPILLPGQID